MKKSIHSIIYLGIIIAAIALTSCANDPYNEVQPELQQTSNNNAEGLTGYDQNN